MDERNGGIFRPGQNNFLSIMSFGKEVSEIINSLDFSKKSDQVNL